MFQRISDSHEMYLDLLTTGWENNYNCNLFQKYGFTISKVCQKSGKQHIQVKLQIQRWPARSDPKSKVVLV